MSPIGPYMTAEDFGAEWGIFDRHNAVIGTVRWYPRWRVHVYEPTAGTVLSEDCLAALSAWMRELNAKRKNPKENQP